MTQKIIMNNIEFWEKQRNKIKVKMGGWLMGDGVITHGHSLLGDLLGNISYFQLIILHTTGRLEKRNIADWLEAAFMCLSWPDPRIWCNHIGALAANAKTTPSAAVTAGTLAGDSRIYGVGTLSVATDFIVNALSFINQGHSIEDYIENQKDSNGKLIIPGFARPLATGDERVEAIQRVEKKLGLEAGPHLKLAYEISNYLYKHHQESLNFAGYVVAFLSDHRFTATDITRIFSAWVSGGVYACYKEFIDEKPFSLLPLRCDDIKYTGQSMRNVPDKK